MDSYLEALRDDEPDVRYSIGTVIKSYVLPMWKYALVSDQTALFALGVGLRWSKIQWRDFEYKGMELKTIEWDWIRYNGVKWS